MLFENCVDWLRASRRSRDPLPMGALPCWWTKRTLTDRFVDARCSVSTLSRAEISDMLSFELGVSRKVTPDRKKERRGRLVGVLERASRRTRLDMTAELDPARVRFSILRHGRGSCVLGGSRF